MSVLSIREAISVRTAEMLTEKLVRKGIRTHKKHAFRYCSCSYCSTKREATLHIGSPIIRHSYKILEDPMDAIRAGLKKKYRALLLEAEEESL